MFSGIGPSYWEGGGLLIIETLKVASKLQGSETQLQVAEN